MQYKIPQNVGIEDRIVGPLTLRQLIILFAGFGTSYVLFIMLNRFYELNLLEYIIILTPGILSTAFALLKINDISLFKFLILFLEFSIKPKKRVWDHQGISYLVDPDLNEPIQKKILKPKVAEEKSEMNLKELTQALDSGGFSHIRETNHPDIDQIEDEDLVTHAYFGNKNSNAKNMYWRTKSTHLKMLEIFSKLPITKLKKGTPETQIAQREIKKIQREVESLKKKRIQKKEKIKKLQPENKKKKEVAIRPKKLAKKKPLSSGKYGEFTFKELNDSDSIEINLD